MVDEKSKWYLGRLTVKQILVKELGEKKAGKIVKEINNACNIGGIHGKDLQKLFTDALKKEGVDPFDFGTIIFSFLDQ